MKHYYYYLPQGQYLTWWVFSFMSSQSCLCSIYKATLCIQKPQFFFPLYFVLASDRARYCKCCTHNSHMCSPCLGGLLALHTGMPRVATSGIEASGGDNFCCAACVTMAPRARLEEAM